jgi:chitin deacetylase
VTLFSSPQLGPLSILPRLPEANIPPEWLQALNKAVADGKIPNITVATTPNGGDGDPAYGTENTTGPEICSSYYNCRADGDVWDLPEGTLGLTFDDGVGIYLSILFIIVVD